MRASHVTEPPGDCMPPQVPCNLYTLSYSTTNDLYPAFSPDGMRIAFVRPQSIPPAKSWIRQSWQSACSMDRSRQCFTCGRTGGQFELVAGWQPLDVRSNPCSVSTPIR